MKCFNPIESRLVVHLFPREQDCQKWRFAMDNSTPGSVLAKIKGLHVDWIEYRTEGHGLHSVCGWWWSRPNPRADPEVTGVTCFNGNYHPSQRSANFSTTYLIKYLLMVSQVTPV